MQQISVCIQAAIYILIFSWFMAQVGVCADDSVFCKLMGKLVRQLILAVRQGQQLCVCEKYITKYC